jgi:phosphatidate cytidylyltransferase
MILVWSSDSWAYVAGKLFGKHKLAPSISPGKTWEGLIGGTILSGLTGFLIVQYLLEPNGGYIGSDNYHTFNPLKGIILGVSISIFGTMGDLFESSLKRKAGVKDSGKVLPGHGGMLDRFDAFLFAAVVFTIVSRIP